MMPSILLINDNKIVSRLLQLSSEKNGYKLKEVTSLEDIDGQYDVVFIDSDKYSDTLLGEIESKLKGAKLGYIGVKQETVPDGFDFVIEKPFLPTDFVEVIKEKVIGSKVQTIETIHNSSEEGIESLDLDDEADVLMEDNLDLDNLDDVDDLLVNENINDEIPLDDIDNLDDIDLSLNPTTVMTTGVATSMVMSENDPEELADMVTELDEMGEDELDTLDDGLIEENREFDIDSTSNKEESSIDEEETIDELSQLESKKETEDNGIGMAEMATGLAAVGAVASQVIDQKDKKEDISKLNELEELNEVDLQQALGEEISKVDDIKEEIISEEIVSEGKETFVEMDDMQEWIRDAVQKAITPQMIQEALNGMDINVTLSFKSKNEDIES